jgi:drug/metabolite transporter (DMT)-like permease
MFGWEPGIGDPTLYGWVTVAAYAFAALCCWRASRRGPMRERRFWLLLSGIMGFLCLNKQLDLQTLFTDIGRFEAKAHGWYAQRHEYQVGFILAVAGVSFIVILTMLRRAARASGPVRGAAAGLGLLLLFVLIRASSFHKVDWLINQRLGDLRANHLLELGGIAIVTVFALAAARRKGGRRFASI